MITYSPIGIIQSVFTEKFGVPRQALMVPEARAVLKLNPNPDFRTALNHLESFSHIWIIFDFHRHLDKPFTPTIRPPRIDAPNRVGVFASRSPDRPNAIGISAVKLERIDFDAAGGIEIHLSGVDLLDQTPVLDIKPYIPYADAIPDARGGWAEGEIPKFSVIFLPESLTAFKEASARHPQLKELVQQMLEWDPRPTSQREAMPISDSKSDGKIFNFRILDVDVQWRIQGGTIEVMGLKKA